MTAADEARAELAVIVDPAAYDGKWPMWATRLEAEAKQTALEMADAILAAGYRKGEVDPSTFNGQVQAERQHQIEKGYNQEHDDQHGVDHLLRWAQEYARRGEPVKSAALIEAAREALLRQASRKVEAPADEREALAGIMRGARNPEGHVLLRYEDAADAILAAGYRKVEVTDEHGDDWSDWQDGDDGPSCKCGFNGSPDDCSRNRAALGGGEPEQVGSATGQTP